MQLFSPPSPPTQMNHSNLTFTSYMRKLPASQQWAWDDLHLQGNAQTMMEALRLGQVHAVSDGSFKVSKQNVPYGTSAWILFASNDLWIKGCNAIPGSTNSQSSYRSELGGIYGLVFAITSLLNYYLDKQAPKFECSVNIGCDGQAALNNCFLFDK